MTFDLQTVHIFAAITAALALIPPVIMGERQRSGDYYHRRNPALPFFLATPSNVTYYVGQEAVLQCVVENRGTRTVVWRKGSDTHPITIGESRFISDDRFKVVNSEHSLAWNLHISDLKPEDAGQYECQVVAKDKKIRQNVVLVVDTSKNGKTFEPKITINGSFFVEKGQTLTLVCQVTGSDYPTADIDWFKDGNKIRSSDMTTLTNNLSMVDSSITSTLAIRRARMKDMGTYVCRTSNLQVTSAKVNILNTDTNPGKRVPIFAESTGASSEGQEGAYFVEEADESPGSRPHASLLTLLSILSIHWVLGRHFVSCFT